MKGLSLVNLMTACRWCFGSSNKPRIIGFLMFDRSNSLLKAARRRVCSRIEHSLAIV